MNYCHTAEHAATTHNLGRVFFLAILINLGFTFLEAAFSFYAHSSSLLADAGHNLGDVLGLGIAWGANYLQHRHPTERFSYGYKRTSVLAAFLNAIILLVTALMIAADAIQHLRYPPPVEEKVVVIVALIGIFVNMGTAFLFRHGHKDMNIKAAFLHLAFDALISLGVVMVAVAIYFTGWRWLDPIVGLMITLVIIVGTWSLFKRSTSLILDAVPHQVDIGRVLNYLKAWPDVADVHDLHIWGLSTTEVALTAHLIVPTRYLEDNELLLLTQALQQEFGIDHVTIQVERGSMTVTH